MLPTVAGTIARRLLVNFRADPEVVARLLPAGTRPKLQQGFAVAGICLIRLEKMHPAFLPLDIGLASENAAHRFAVTFDDGQTGVYIPRRDTNSTLSHALGGRLVPGVHHAATFQVADDGEHVVFSMESADGVASVQVAGTPAGALPETSIFATLQDSSSFFEEGAIGLSDGPSPGTYHRIELVAPAWKVAPFEVERVHSSYFSNESLFPKGSVEFDHALVMRDIRHEWRSVS